MKNTKFITKDFQDFINSVNEINYHEVYDLYQAANSNVDGQSTFTVEKAAGTTDDILIGYEPTNSFLRLTPKAAAFFPEWIKANLMEDMDAESFWGMKHAMEKDEEEERRNH